MGNRATSILTEGEFSCREHSFREYRVNSNRGVSLISSTSSGLMGYRSFSLVPSSTADISLRKYLRFFCNVQNTMKRAIRVARFSLARGAFRATTMMKLHKRHHGHYCNNNVTIIINIASILRRHYAHINTKESICQTRTFCCIRPVYMRQNCDERIFSDKSTNKRQAN